MRRAKIIFTAIFLVMAVIVSSGVVYGGVCDGLSRDDCKKKIEELERQVASLSKQSQTLSSQIAYMNTQINLTSARITQTEKNIEATQEEIENLGGRIESLNKSLDSLTRILLFKITKGYKQRRASMFDILLDPDNAASLINRVKYVQAARNSDHFLALKLERTKVSYEDQKDLREKKKQDLEKLKSTLATQKINLDSQRAAKQQLLAVTKNDEKVYQALLARARAEFAAIQGIVSGAGTETKIRDVSKGESIAFIIPGRSCNSSGSHLHFIVQDGGGVKNPFSYLKPVDFQNCSGSSCGSGDGDPFNPSGDWNWPLSPQIKMYQGYGETWAVRNTWAGRIYRFHNGVDIIGSSSNVRAVNDGVLYRGSYSVGCALQYVRLVHKDSNVSTLYLHVYAQ